MREGAHTGLLDGLHASGCTGQEYSACRAVPNGDKGFLVVFMTWCGDCGAADFEEV